MNELTQASKMTETIRQPMACIYLLGWELIGSFVLGSGQCDFAFCERLLDPLLSDYPDGAIILFLKGRYYLIRGDVDNAIHFYNKSIKVQDSYKQFHHICYWELLFAFSFLQQWDRAAHNTKKLLDESKWSKCVYTYLMAILINADKKVDKRKETVALLANKVGKLRLRIAGKSIPVEKFCEKKAARYLKTGSFMLSHYEFFYFWHAFNILNSNQRQIRLILNDIEATSKQVVEEKEVDVNDQCLYYFLTGVCYRVLGQIEDANSAFNFVISNESVLTDSFYLVPNATYELALLRRDSGNSEQCDVLLKKALIYRGYSLETRLHLKIHNIASYL
uniref:TPR_REGION domain-containing protein n=1 Tax=Rhabditophanes sp. KR3021 TaxID=114890 RepID=A0AC35UCC9_9BILA